EADDCRAPSRPENEAPRRSVESDGARRAERSRLSRDRRELMRWVALAALTIVACSETTATPDGGSLSLSDGAPAPECGSGGRAYYVDSLTGDDSRSGTSSAQAWKTLAKVSSMTFEPGDTLCLARGGQFPGTLTLHGNGTAG